LRVEGKSFAIVDQKPVASGTDAKNVYEEAKAKLPTPDALVLGGI